MSVVLTSYLQAETVSLNFISAVAFCYSLCQMDWRHNISPRDSLRSCCLLIGWKQSATGTSQRSWSGTGGDWHTAAPSA